MNSDLQNREGSPAKQLLPGSQKAMEINKADVAELVDARDLKSGATIDDPAHSCKTDAGAHAETAPVPGHLQNNYAAISVLKNHLSETESLRRNLVDRRYEYLARAEALLSEIQRIDKFIDELRASIRDLGGAA